MASQQGKTKNLRQKRKGTPEYHAFAERIANHAFDIDRVIAEATAYRKAHPEHLSVLDAPTEEEFIKNARVAYRKAHPPRTKRGRSREEINALMCLSDMPTAGGTLPRQSSMVRALMNLGLSKNTSYKYARLYILYRKGYREFRDPDRRWLLMHIGPESLNEVWWQDKIWELWEEKARRAGVLEEIRKLFQQT